MINPSQRTELSDAPIPLHEEAEQRFREERGVSIPMMTCHPLKSLNAELKVTTSAGYEDYSTYIASTPVCSCFCFARQVNGRSLRAIRLDT